MLKKKNYVKVLALVLAFVMSTASTVYALDLDLKKDKELITDETCVSDFITYSQENNEYKSSISQQNLARLKTCFDTDEVSKEEMYTEIFRELGYSDEEIDATGMEEINYIMESSIEITVNTEYVLIDQDGNREVVSKDDCLIFAEKVNAERELELQKILSQTQDNQLLSENGGPVTMAAASNGSSNTETLGAMKITTVSSYINPSSVSNQKGWYNFSATFKWLTVPSQRHNDAFSLYAAQCAWSQTPGDMYSSMTEKVTVFTDTVSKTNTITSTKTTQDRSINSGGLYYTWELLEDAYSFAGGAFVGIKLDEISFYIRGKARVPNQNANYNFNVFSRYEHLTKDISVSSAFSWSANLGGINYPGVTVTATVKDNHTPYESYNYTSYNPKVYK